MIIERNPNYEGGNFNYQTGETKCYSHYGIYSGGYFYEIQCDVCSKIFLSDRPKKYCCKECAIKANSELRKKQKAEHRNKVCEHCNKPLDRKSVV